MIEKSIGKFKKDFSFLNIPFSDTVPQQLESEYPTPGFVITLVELLP